MAVLEIFSSRHEIETKGREPTANSAKAVWFLAYSIGDWSSWAAC